MNRSLIILLGLILVCGTQAVFATGVAQETKLASNESRLQLPEPVLNAGAGETVPDSSRAGRWLPDLVNAVSFLWSSGSSDEADFVEYIPSLVVADAATGDAEIPMGIRNNKYFVESVRLNILAQQAYDEGDYDASTQYSEDAVRYAQLSDEYVRLQLKIKETDDAIAAARSRLDFAASVNAATRYPAQYNQAQTAYTEARTLRAAQSWDDAIAAANRVLVALAYVDAEQEKAPVAVAVAEGPLPLPAQYTVRPWNVAKDCLWNIAGRSWVYNDPRKWKILYDANKTGMPQPDNPDLIHPGMVLNIPSLKGETRQGMWDASKMYQPLP